jgi:hypothetical protein
VENTLRREAVQCGKEDTYVFGVLIRCRGSVWMRAAGLNAALSSDLAAA